MSDKDGLAKNWLVVKEELRLYAAHAMAEVKWIKNLDASLARKLHHLSGLGPDAHRIMPRTLWYLTLLSIPVIIALVWWVV